MAALPRLARQLRGALLRDRRPVDRSSGPVVGLASPTTGCCVRAAAAATSPPRRARVTCARNRSTPLRSGWKCERLLDEVRHRGGLRLVIGQHAEAVLCLLPVVGLVDQLEHALPGAD